MYKTKNNKYVYSKYVKEKRNNKKSNLCILCQTNILFSIFH